MLSCHNRKKEREYAELKEIRETFKNKFYEIMYLNDRHTDGQNNVYTRCSYIGIFMEYLISLSSIAAEKISFPS